MLVLIISMRHCLPSHRKISK